MTKTNRDLQTGGLQFKPLAYDQVLGLTSVIHQLCGRRLLVVVDAIEQSPDSRRAIGLLRQFLDEVKRWPECHFLLAVRKPGELEQEEEAYKEAVRLKEAHGRLALIYDLPLMDLRDILEQDELCRHIQSIVPACKQLSSDEIVKQLSGYPGTLYRWKTERPDTKESLQKTTEDAQTYQYPELRRIMDRIRGRDAALFRSATRLALLAEFNSPQDWKPFIDFFEDTNRVTADLQYEQLLEACDPPSFGHTTRLQALRSELQEHFAADLAHAGNNLCWELASRIRDTEITQYPYALALAGLPRFCPKLSDVSTGLAMAATTLFASSLKGPVARCMHAATEAARTNPFIAPLVAMGVLSVLNEAQRENDFSRCDSILDEFRQLSQVHNNLAAVVERFAMALFNSLVGAAERKDLGKCDALLDELRHLAQAHSDLTEVVTALSRGLVIMLFAAKDVNNLPRRDALLDELRRLAQASKYPPEVSGRLAVALFTTQNDAQKENDLPRRDALLDELRRLAQANSDQVEIVKYLSIGLFFALDDAKNENNLAGRDALLEELRQLARAHHDQADVVDQLAKGLFEVLVHAEKESDLLKRDYLLDELRQLAQTYGDQASVVLAFAKGLNNTLIDNLETDPILSDALLEELRQLARDHADQPEVLKQLASGLVNILINATQTGNLSRRDALLKELKQVAQTNDNHDILKSFALGLRCAFLEAQFNKDLGRCDALRKELALLLPRLPADSDTRATILTTLQRE